MRIVERHGYLLLFVWILAEQAALPIPSVPLLVAVGAVIRADKLNPIAAIACCVAGSLIADFVWFQLGRLRGKKVLKFLCRISMEPDSCVRQTENAFIRYGLKALLLAKFIPGFNAVAAPLAGDSGISVIAFLAVDAAGVIIWSATFMGLGSLFSDQLELLLNWVERMGSGFFILMISLLALWLLWKFVQRRRFLHQLKGARISAEELRERIDAGEDLCIVDLRRPDDDEHSIPGAVKISVEELRSSTERLPRGREVILFCSCPNDTSSARMAILLRAKGVTNVRPLRGGSDAWVRMMRAVA